MKPAIRVEKLSKTYHLGRGPRFERNLQENLVHGLRSWWQRLLGNSSAGQHDFWALRDVSFDVHPGEVVGVIGRNGAGKSTLLKILSRIVEPSGGRAEVRGRLGSLLEVGTGFHAELSGRENIFLNGSLIGMKRAEILRKFDEIVAFAEIEKFLDVPVKRYSSGMYVRLAFAVAAHLEPEILLVDEVLAVGDATYQRRCIERMSEMASGGRTILFVSHSMDVIPRLCRRAVLLEGGHVKEAGPAAAVIDRYLQTQLDAAGDGDLRDKPRTGDGRARFTQIRHVDAQNRPLRTHASGDDLILRMDIEAVENISNVALAVILHTLTGTRIITSWTPEVNYRVSLREGLQTFECAFRNVRLRPGHCVGVQLWMATQHAIDSVDHATIIEIVSREDSSHWSTDANQGIVTCDYDWSEVQTSARRG